jgi:hypothetical protein
MKRTLLALVFGALAPLGCGDGSPMQGNGGGATMHPQTLTAICHAATAPSMFSYQVNGNQATLTPAVGGASTALTLLTSAHGARPIYGTWSLPVQTDSHVQALGLSITASIEIESDHVTVSTDCSLKGKSATVSATSKAEVTDDTLTIEESNERNQTITYP